MASKMEPEIGTYGVYVEILSESVEKALFSCVALPSASMLVIRCDELAKESVGRDLLRSSTLGNAPSARADVLLSLILLIVADLGRRLLRVLLYPHQ